MRAYETRLQTFLRVLEEEENKMAETVNLAEIANGISLAGSENNGATTLSVYYVTAGTWEHSGASTDAPRSNKRLGHKAARSCIVLTYISSS